MSQPSRLALLHRIRRLGAAASQLNCDATIVAGTALRLWCKQQFKFAPAPKLPSSSELAATSQLKNFVGLLMEMDFLEASYWLSSTYAMLADEAYRKKLAMFFTPASLTRGLLDDLAAQGVDFGKHSFMDPACGGAAFLAPIAFRMKEELEAKGLSSRARLKHIERHLFGTDKDATLCKLSRQFLYMALHNDIEDSGYVPMFIVEAADSLKSERSKLGRRDVVVCNPPYRKLSAAEVALLDPAFEQVTEAQPNLYSIFIFHCVRLVRPGGVVALVTPTSFLSGQYFSGLRSFLIRSADVEHIGMVSERKGVFIDVEQEAALTVLRRRVPDNRVVAPVKVSVVSVAGKYTPVGTSIFLDYGGFVGENHIVILEPCVDLPELQPNDLADLLRTHSVDRIYRCISGATNVSSFELSQLALPDPAKLKKYRSQGSSMEEAVNRSYGLDLSGVAKQARNRKVP